MGKTALIIAGVLCLLLLALFLIAVVPKIKAELSRMPVWGYLLVILLLAGALVFIGIRLFGSKGPDSLLSEDVSGSEKGDQETAAPEEAEASFDLKGAVGDTGAVEIRVHGTEVYFGSAPLTDAAELAAVLEETRDETAGRAVRLEDDYAHSGTYKEVRNVLEERGIPYSEKILE